MTSHARASGEHRGESDPAGPKRTTDRAQRVRSRRRRPREALGLLRRCMDSPASGVIRFRPRSGRSSDPRSAARSARVFAGVAAMPSSMTGTPRSVPTGRARYGSGARSVDPRSDRAGECAGGDGDRGRRDYVARVRRLGERERMTISSPGVDPRGRAPSPIGDTHHAEPAARTRTRPPGPVPPRRSPPTRRPR